MMLRCSRATARKWLLLSSSAPACSVPEKGEQGHEHICEMHRAPPDTRRTGLGDVHPCVASCCHASYLTAAENVRTLVACSLSMCTRLMHACTGRAATLSTPASALAFPPNAPIILSCSTSLSTLERLAVEESLSKFDIALGSCERISRQSIPLVRCLLLCQCKGCACWVLPSWGVKRGRARM
jgi:hypothetical protein